MARKEDAKKAAKGDQETPQAEEGRSSLREYLEALLIAAIFLGFSNTFLVKTFYIPSSSMEDTLLVGDHLFVNRYAYGLEATPLERMLMPGREIDRGDVVIFRSPKEPRTDLVKRCIGLPGDEIRIVDKQLYLNGERVDDGAYAHRRDPKVFPSRRFLSPEVRHRDNFGPVVVPENQYFFLGDNRDQSYDSRFWGSVPRHMIKGRALLIYWSYGGETPDGTWRGWGAKVSQLAGTIAGFFTRTRWERTFHLIR